MPLSRERSNGHEMLRATLRSRYEPYDRIFVGAPEGRLRFTVLGCEPSGEDWRVMAIRCLEDCTVHRRRR